MDITSAHLRLAAMCTISSVSEWAVLSCALLP